MKTCTFPELPHDVVLLIFDLAAAEDSNTAKALRGVTRECALRHARSVWIVGARAWYLDYMRALQPTQRRLTMRLLVPNASELQLRHAIRAAAAVAAQATSEAMPEDALLFRALSNCSKFRGRE